MKHSSVMRPRFAHFGLILLSLSCAPAWADSFASFTIGDTTAFISLPKGYGASGSSLTTIRTSANTYGLASASTGSSSAYIGSNTLGSNLFMSRFGPMSGSSDSNDLNPLSEASAHGFVYGTFSLQNTADYSIWLPVSASLAIANASSSISVADKWSDGGALIYSSLVFWTTNGATTLTSTDLDCFGAAQGGIPACEVLHFAPSGNFSVVSPGNSIAITESIFLPASSTINLDFESRVEGYAWDETDHPKPTSPSPTPEPGTLSLLGSGLVCLGAVIHRRWQR